MADSLIDKGLRPKERLAVMAGGRSSKSEAEQAEIPACEILDKIQKGEPAAYDRARIIGDLM